MKLGTHDLETCFVEFLRGYRKLCGRKARIPWGRDELRYCLRAGKTVDDAIIEAAMEEDARNVAEVPAVDVDTTPVKVSGPVAVKAVGAGKRGERILAPPAARHVLHSRNANGD